MANNCIVGIVLTADSENGAANLEIMFSESRKTAREKDEGMFIGCANRYFFDCEIFRDRDTLFLHGWVKWGFSNDEIKTFIGWLKKQSVITSLHITYDEPGALSYGKYNFDGRTLTHCYIPQNAYPDEEEYEGEEDGQKFAAELESVLESSGVTEQFSIA